MPLPSALLPSLLLGLALATAPAAAGDKDKSGVSYKGRANLTLAQSYLQSGDPATALDRANRALRTDPKSGEVHAILGMIHARMGNPDKAEDHYARSIRLAPDDGPVLNIHAVWLCQRGEYDKADAQFARALQDPLYVQTLQTQRNAGRCALDAGKLEKAEAYYRLALEKAPDDPQTLFSLADVSLRKGDALNARGFIQRRDELGGSGPEVLELAARIEDGAGDAAAAARYRKRLQEQFPDYQPPTREAPRQP